MIEKSKQIDYILNSNSKLNEGLEIIIEKYSKIYKSYSKEACFLLEKILVDYFSKFNLNVKVSVQQDLIENIRINIDLI